MTITPGLLQKTVFSHPLIRNFNPFSRAVFQKLRHCRTASNGMHRFTCDNGDCNHVHWQYHSCGNRHCPSCGAWKKEEWIEHKTADLLPTAYYHVVFTLPHEINALTMRHRTRIFKLLFDASAHTLLTLGTDSRYVGGEVGFTSILHTWGQQLSFHPHIHCIVSGGGVRNGKWVSEKRKNNNFLFPRRAMEKVFKGYFLHHLRQYFHKRIFDMDEPDFKKLIDQIGYKKWNVYAKKPFGGPQQVIEYLGRYTHKVAITQHRIISIDDHNISFRYKDYADHSKSKVMTLPQGEFVRRFEQHILPKGFVKIRNYGFMKNYRKRERLDLLRASMDLQPAPPNVRVPVRQRLLEKWGRDISRCPKCEKGTMKLMETIRRYYRPHAALLTIIPGNHSP